jgi:hypothetical protein
MTFYFATIIRGNESKLQEVVMSRSKLPEAKPKKNLLPTLPHPSIELDPSRKKIEEQLAAKIEALNAAGAINKERLGEIIDLCNAYIEGIPRDERTYYFYDLSVHGAERVKDFDTKYPLAVKVAEIQRLAVQYSFLPASTSWAKSMWLKVRDILVDKEHTGFLLQEEYHTEAAYAGQIAVSHWIYQIKEDDLRSYNEMLQSAQKVRGISVENVFYANEVQQQSRLLARFASQDDEVRLVNQAGEALNSVTQVLDPATGKLETVRVIGISSFCTLYAFTNNQLLVLDKMLAVEHPDQYKHHSSLVAGKRTDCAGTMEIEDGKIIVLTNDSGHYTPDAKQLIGLILFLEANKVDLSQTKIRVVIGNDARKGGTLFKEYTLEEYKQQYKAEFAEAMHKEAPKTPLFTPPSFAPEEDETRNKAQMFVAKQVGRLNRGEAINHQELALLIEMANEYIESIPFEDRSLFVYYQNIHNAQAIAEFTAKYPNAAEIFAIQKRAVLLSLLPQSASLALASWKQVQSLLELEGIGNRISSTYWTEIGFKGRIDLYRWIKGVGENDMLSYRERAAKSFLLDGFNVKRVYYPTQEDRDLFQVQVSEQRLTNQNGKPLISFHREVISGIPIQETLFALTSTGFFALDKEFALKHPSYLFRHSSLVGGERCIAGTMRIEDGEVLMISNNTGHYQTSPEQLIVLLDYLQAKGVDLSNTQVQVVTIEDERPKTTIYRSPQEFLAKYAPDKSPDPDDTPADKDLLRR